MKRLAADVAGVRLQLAVVPHVLLQRRLVYVTLATDAARVRAIARVRTLVFREVGSTRELATALVTWETFPSVDLQSICILESFNFDKIVIQYASHQPT